MCPDLQRNVKGRTLSKVQKIAFFCAFLICHGIAFQAIAHTSPEDNDVKAEAEGADKADTEGVDKADAEGVDSEAEVEQSEDKQAEGERASDGQAKDTNAEGEGADDKKDKDKQKEEVGLGVSPFGAVAYSQETNVLFGAAAILFYRFPKATKRRDWQLGLSAAYTLKNQITSLIFSEIYLLQNRIRIDSSLSVSYFPDSFFGLGNATDFGDREPYTPLYAELSVSPRYRVINKLFVGPSLRLRYADIRTTTAGGFLEVGDIIGSNGGMLSQLGVSAVYDARDNILYPYRGSEINFDFLWGESAWGSDFSNTLTRVDAKFYFPTFFDKHVLAVQGLAEFRSGTVPFYDLGLLGGDQLVRGFFQGRYRDNHMIVAQVEYRMPVWWKFGSTFFASIGEVANQVKDLKISELKYSTGFGIRFSPSRKAPVNIRLDFAWGGNRDGFISASPQFYINLGEAF